MCDGRPLPYIAFDPSVRSSIARAALGATAEVTLRETDRSTIVTSFEAL